MCSRWLRRCLVGGLVLTLSLVGTRGTAWAQFMITLESPVAETARFGYAVTMADVTGDGRADIVVGAPLAASGWGRVYVFDGQTRNRLYTLAPPGGTGCGQDLDCYYGAAVAAGDVTGDGRADIIIGAPRENVGSNTGQGRVYVYDGATGGLMRVLTTPTPQLAAGFGEAVAAGDLSGDGRRQVIVGAPGQCFGSPLVCAGQVFAFDGATGALVHTFQSPNIESRGSFGAALTTGNVAGSGAEELVVGAPEESVGGVAAQGRAYVFLPERRFGRGPEQEPAPTPTLAPPGVGVVTLTAPGPPVCDLGQNGCWFGLALSTADIDGDGRAEVVVGANLEDVDGVPDQGRVYVFDITGNVGRLRSTLTTPNPWSVCPPILPGPPPVVAECNRFGRSVAAGDVNADGYADIIVGANSESVTADGPRYQGRAYVFSGRDGTLLWRLDAPNPDPPSPSGAPNEVLFGTAVAAGDLNQDGAADFVVGAFRQDVAGISEQGRVYLFLGQRGVRVGFESPQLGADDRRVVNPYVSAGVTFAAEPAGGFTDSVVGLVKNSATSACVEPADANQMLGTGRTAVGPDARIGFGGFPIRATFDRPLVPAGEPVRLTAEFQTLAGTTIRLRLFGPDGTQVGSAMSLALPADGTCSYPGEPRASQRLTATSNSPVAYAIMDVLPLGTRPDAVFVIDNVGWTP